MLFNEICVVELVSNSSHKESPSPSDSKTSSSSLSSHAKARFSLILPHGDPSQVDSNVLKFCFPDLDHLLEAPRFHESSTQEYTFTLTRRNEPQLFGFCRRYRVSSSAVGDRIDLVGPVQESEVVMFQALCILSEKPYFRFFSHCLQLLHSACMCSGDAALKLAKTLLAFNSAAAGAIIPLRSLLTSSQIPGHLGFPREHLRVPRNVGLPLLDTPLSPLLSRLEVPALLALYVALLCERRILFVSQSISSLSTSIHASMLLIQPLKWQHIFIPLVTDDFLPYVTAPNPFVIGCTVSQFDVLRKDYEIGEVVLVSLDEGYVACLNGADPLVDLEGSTAQNGNTGFIMYAGPKSPSDLILSSLSQLGYSTPELALSSHPCTASAATISLSQSLNQHSGRAGSRSLANLANLRPSMSVSMSLGDQSIAVSNSGSLSMVVGRQGAPPVPFFSPLRSLAFDSESALARAHRAAALTREIQTTRANRQQWLQSVLASTSGSSSTSENESGAEIGLGIPPEWKASLFSDLDQKSQQFLAVELGASPVGVNLASLSSEPGPGGGTDAQVHLPLLRSKLSRRAASTVHSAAGVLGTAGGSGASVSGRTFGRGFLASSSSASSTQPAVTGTNPNSLSALFGVPRGSDASSSSSSSAHAPQSVTSSSLTSAPPAASGPLTFSVESSSSAVSGAAAVPISGSQGSNESQPQSQQHSVVSSEVAQAVGAVESNEGTIGKWTRRVKAAASRSALSFGSPLPASHPSDATASPVLVRTLGVQNQPVKPSLGSLFGPSSSSSSSSTNNTSTTASSQLTPSPRAPPVGAGALAVVANPQYTYGRSTGAASATGMNVSSADCPSLRLLADLRRQYEQCRSSGAFDEPQVLAAFLSFFACVFGNICEFVYSLAGVDVASVLRGEVEPEKHDPRLAKEDFLKLVSRPPVLTRLVSDAMNSQMLYTFACDQFISTLQEAVKSSSSGSNSTGTTNAPAAPSMSLNGGVPGLTAPAIVPHLLSDFLGLSTGPNSQNAQQTLQSQQSQHLSRPLAPSQHQRYSEISRRVLPLLWLCTDTLLPPSAGPSQGVLGTGLSLALALEACNSALQAPSATPLRPPLPPCPAGDPAPANVLLTAIRALCVGLIAPHHHLPPQELPSSVVRAVLATSSGDDRLLSVWFGAVVAGLALTSAPRWTGTLKALRLLRLLLTVGSPRAQVLGQFLLPQLLFLVQPSRARALAASARADELLVAAETTYVAQNAAVLLSTLRKAGLLDAAAAPLKEGTNDYVQAYSSYFKPRVALNGGVSVAATGTVGATARAPSIAGSLTSAGSTFTNLKRSVTLTWGGISLIPTLSLPQGSVDAQVFQLPPSQGLPLLAVEAARCYQLLVSPSLLALQRALQRGPAAAAHGVPPLLPYLYPLVPSELVRVPGAAALPRGPNGVWTPTAQRPFPPAGSVAPGMGVLRRVFDTGAAWLPFDVEDSESNLQEEFKYLCRVRRVPTMDFLELHVGATPPMCSSTSLALAEELPQAVRFLNSFDASLVDSVNNAELGDSAGAIYTPTTGSSTPSSARALLTGAAKQEGAPVKFVAGSLFAALRAPRESSHLAANFTRPITTTVSANTAASANSTNSTSIQLQTHQEVAASGAASDPFYSLGSSTASSVSSFLATITPARRGSVSGGRTPFSASLESTVSNTPSRVSAADPAEGNSVTPTSLPVSLPVPMPGSSTSSSNSIFAALSAAVPYFSAQSTPRTPSRTVSAEDEFGSGGGILRRISSSSKRHRKSVFDDLIAATSSNNAAPSDTSTAVDSRTVHLSVRAPTLLEPPASALEIVQPGPASSGSEEVAVVSFSSFTANSPIVPSTFANTYSEENGSESTSAEEQTHQDSPTTPPQEDSQETKRMLFLSDDDVEVASEHMEDVTSHSSLAVDVENDSALAGEQPMTESGSDAPSDLLFEGIVSDIPESSNAEHRIIGTSLSPPIDCLLSEPASILSDAPSDVTMPTPQVVETPEQRQKVDHIEVSDLADIQLSPEFDPFGSIASPLNNTTSSPSALHVKSREGEILSQEDPFGFADFITDLPLMSPPPPLSSFIPGEQGLENRVYNIPDDSISKEGEVGASFFDRLSANETLSSVPFEYDNSDFAEFLTESNDRMHVPSCPSDGKHRHAKILAAVGDKAAVELDLQESSELQLNKCSAVAPAEKENGASAMPVKEFHLLSPPPKELIQLAAMHNNNSILNENGEQVVADGQAIAHEMQLFDFRHARVPLFEDDTSGHN